MKGYDLSINEKPILRGQQFIKMTSYPFRDDKFHPLTKDTREQVTPCQI